MSDAIAMNRRTFLKVCAAVGGGLMVGVYLPGCSRGDDFPRPPETFTPNAWIRVGYDGTITFMIERAEMGQGVVTALAMLLAEELEVDPEQVETRFALARKGMGSTGGSNSIRLAWDPLRKGAAAARELLIRAAAEQWNVPASECHASEGAVHHRPSGRSLAYGELAPRAATYSVPDDVPLKSPADYRLIGRPRTPLDAAPKARGEVRFGMDVTIPGMKIAVLARPPVFGASAGKVDDRAARALPGVHAVVVTKAGVAVVAEDFPTAIAARDLLRIEWSETERPDLDSAAIARELEAGLEEEGDEEVDRGDAEEVIEEAERVIEAVYRTPFLAHAPMEPMNCTVDLGDDRCRVWVPTQNQAKALEVVADITGLPRDRIELQPTFIGGGFGRRLKVDYVAEAVEIATRVKVPLKLMGTMRESIQGGYYRPANITRLRAVLDDKGRPAALHARFVGPRFATDGVDFPYAIPNLLYQRVERSPDMPLGAWRSVGASQNAFAVECFIDELAHAAGRDPLAYRLDLLGDASPRYRGVLEAVARAADWGNPAPGRAQGVALYHSFRSWAAQVVELSVAGDGAIRVHRVVCAIDCGRVVNPDTVRAQMEGGVIFALTAALKGRIELDKGRVKQSNYYDYPLLTMAECPEIEVVIVPSEADPTGVGEPGVPPLAPALANALFAATGERVRELPLQPS